MDGRKRRRGFILRVLAERCSVECGSVRAEQGLIPKIFLRCWSNRRELWEPATDLSYRIEFRWHRRRASHRVKNDLNYGRIATTIAQIYPPRGATQKEYPRFRRELPSLETA